MGLGFSYWDPLYGSIEIPEWLMPLFNTKLAIRARDITMGTVPNSFRESSALPSRFVHGVGVAHLANEVRFHNSIVEEDSLMRLLIVSGLMHDWGNSALAHLLERLMKEKLNHDGESFLEVLFDSRLGYDTKLELKRLGVSPRDVVDVITGKKRPLSDLIHGDLDLDNLDNIYRYALSVGFSNQQPVFNGYKIAQCLVKREDGVWVLKEPSSWLGDHSLLFHLLEWRNMRRKVYDSISSAPHLLVASMIFSAAWIANEKGYITPNHFLDSDTPMVALLCRKVPSIMDRVVSRRWHKQILNFSTTNASARLSSLANDFKSRIILADKFATRYKIDISQVTIYAGADKMERSIHVPFVDSDGVTKSVDAVLAEKFPTTGGLLNPINFRVNINIDPDIADRFKDKVIEFAHDEIL